MLDQFFLFEQAQWVDVERLDCYDFEVVGVLGAVHFDHHSGLLFVGERLEDVVDQDLNKFELVEGDGRSEKRWVFLANPDEFTVSDIRSKLVMPAFKLFQVSSEH